MTFDREQLKSALTLLAADGVFVGTSSWKYPGWLDSLYDRARYVWRGRFSESRFERLCLAEYAEVFKTVCVDAAYYKFPDARTIEGLVGQVPKDFRFGFKVTDEITLRRFPNLPRFGRRAGSVNPHFLDAELFARAFLSPLEPVRDNVGVIIFEFARFGGEDFTRGREFVAALEQFLGALPRGWPYGIEIRNRNFLQPEYFQTLSRHGVAHIYNSWADMPSVGEQMILAESRTSPELCGARFLLKPGRKYEEAVKLFSPYQAVKEPNLDARAAAAKLIEERRKTGSGKIFIYVNNRLEGNALETICAVLAKILPEVSAKL